jgi:hypothetical protein
LEEEGRLEMTEVCIDFLKIAKFVVSAAVLSWRIHVFCFVTQTIKMFGQFDP